MRKKLYAELLRSRRIQNKVIWLINSIGSRAITINPISFSTVNLIIIFTKLIPDKLYMTYMAYVVYLSYIPIAMCGLFHRDRCFSLKYGIWQKLLEQIVWSQTCYLHWKISLRSGTQNLYLNFLNGSQNRTKNWLIGQINTVFCFCDRPVQRFLLYVKLLSVNWHFETW